MDFTTIDIAIGLLLFSLMMNWFILGMYFYSTSWNRKKLDLLRKEIVYLREDLVGIMISLVRRISFPPSSESSVTESKDSESENS